MDDLRVFAGSSNRELAKEICDRLGMELSAMEISRFSNGNLHVQVLENVRERDVFVVQSFTEPVHDHVMELFIIMDALRSASAKRITAVIPYFSYARSDKKDAPRISIVGRLMADLIKTAGADRVLTMDLHSDSVHGFFSIPVDHLTAVPLIAQQVQQCVDRSMAVAVATDAGGAKRVGKFAKHLEVPMAIIDKRRVGDTEVVQGLVVGDVEGRDAVIFDDEISTGGTLAATADTLARAGVRRMIMGATHPVLCGNAMENIASSKVENIIVTNTVHMKEEKRSGKISVISVAPLMAEAIKRIHTGESVGALFEQ
ncbi:MAG: ribose-phosphate pyrophosphokinase [Thermodesulfobacteriota bacterium]|nr:ribose-phosphate pyrophosphokinase [Thermodesulfobacteriota bacterium]